MGISTQIQRLLGISAYQPANQLGLPSLGDRAVADRRETVGGNIVPQSPTRTRWYLADLESATMLADRGELQLAAQLWRACKRDGVFAGVLSTRTSGLVRLPKKFRGRPDIVEALRAGVGSPPDKSKRGARKRAAKQAPRSVFDEMFPKAELAMLEADGIGLGVGVAELVPVKGRDYPVMTRLDPQFLVYRQHENRWYYQSTVGLLPITPGDGKWILHSPGARICPWQNGIWAAVGQAFIDKAHARLYRSNWEGKLANPARVAVSPQGATDEQDLAWFQRVAAWGVNTVFGVKPGYDVRLLESNGRGYECFGQTITASEREMIIAVTGQTVTVDGGSGFQNNDIHKTIRSDLIQESGDSLAYTINTQGIPPWVQRRFGSDALDECALVEWDTTPPQDLTALAGSLKASAEAAEAWETFLAKTGRALDTAELCQRFGVPVSGDIDGDGEPDVEGEAPIVNDAEGLNEPDDFEADNDNAEAA